MPIPPCIDGVVDLLRCCDEITPIMRVGVQVESKETFVRELASPGVAFVARLPYRIVVQANKYSLRRTSIKQSRLVSW